MATACAVRSGKSMGQDAALHILTEGRLDMERDAVREASVLPAGSQVRLQVLANGFVQDGPCRAARAVDRCAR